MQCNRKLYATMTMNDIADLTKTYFPDYKRIASNAYNIDYGNLWEKPMYQSNSTFLKLKQKYGSKPLNRDSIINLFNQGKYYEAFLCAMVWGNFGTYLGGKTRFNEVFDAANKTTIENNINGVINLLQQGNVACAFNSLCNNNCYKINGVGISFFTKLLYFAGASITNPPLNPQPLIFDSVMKGVYEKILKRINATKPKGLVNQYIDYCNKMEQLRSLINLPTVGHVEALLFDKKVQGIL